MTNTNRGFTLIEILIVLLVLSILMAIAVPSIMGVANKMKVRSLDSKIEAIEEAAVVYAQENSNKIKSRYGVCKSNSSYCECAQENTDCKYKFTMTVDELIHAGVYETEKTDDLDTTCDVTDPRDAKKCLDCVQILIKLDDDYKNATAEIKIEDIKDGKAICN